MKKAIVVLLVLALLVPVSVPGCARQPAAEPPAPAEAPAAVQFTDSAGRTVELPADIKKVAISGPLAQIVLFALCPDKLVGIATAWDRTAEEYLASKYYSLPELGQLYGGKGELNLETLLDSGAQVVVDVGEPKKTIVEDLDALQEQTGIPFVHISATTATMGGAYRKLGELVGMPGEAEALAAYCDRVYARTEALAGSVTKANLLYITGDAGLNVIAKGSYHAEIIDLLSNNLAEVAEPSSKGTGNEVDMEQILKWNPEVILFAPGSIYATAASDAAWQKIAAIKNGNYYEVPFGPYNWMGFPPSVQRYLGMMWMARLLYPETAQDDLYQAVAEYYRLFYHCELTEAQYDALMANSIGMQQAAGQPDLTGHTLSIYCGAGMTRPFQAIADNFEAATGCEMEITFANAAQIQTQINTAQEGDLFIAGSKEETKPVEAAVSASLDLVRHIPVIAVQAGNPKGITGLADLAKEGVEVLIGDPEATPIGKIAMKAFEDAGIKDTVTIAANTATAPAMATALAAGGADAAIVWKENCNVEGVEILQSTDMDKYVKVVPAASLIYCDDAEALAAFVAYLGSEADDPVWEQFGYELAA